jgi:hypothetical protein
MPTLHANSPRWNLENRPIVTYFFHRFIFKL